MVLAPLQWDPWDSALPWTTSWSSAFTDGRHWLGRGTRKALPVPIAKVLAPWTYRSDIIVIILFPLPGGQVVRAQLAQLLTCSAFWVTRSWLMVRSWPCDTTTSAWCSLRTVKMPFVHYSCTIKCRILRCTEVHWDVIFKYLSSPGVIIPPAPEKHSLIQHAKGYWGKHVWNWGKPPSQLRPLRTLDSQQQEKEDVKKLQLSVA